MRIGRAFNTLLLGRGASRGGARAVRIVQACYAFLFRDRASRSAGRAISVSLAGERELASPVVATFSSAQFSSSPVVKRAVSGSGTFYAATSVYVAVRKAIILTIVISGTEGHAGVGDGIAVRLVVDFTTVERSALLGGRSSSARVATSITSTVRRGCRAIGVGRARSANTSGSVAFRLARCLSSI